MAIIHLRCVSFRARLICGFAIILSTDEGGSDDSRLLQPGLKIARFALCKSITGCETAGHIVAIGIFLSGQLFSRAVFYLSDS
jgi:hypothetical protein